MRQFDAFLEANQEYAQSFDQGDLPMPPARKVAILTCMDARMYPERFLGLHLGDAHIIRNAGGRATPDAVRSLVISQRLLGTTEVVVIHHTDCGMVTFSNADLVAKIKQDLGVDIDVADSNFLPFTNLEQSVRDDVAALRASPLIPKNIPITGAIYDVHSGALREIIRA